VTYIITVLPKDNYCNLCIILLILLIHLNNLVRNILVVLGVVINRRTLRGVWGAEPPPHSTVNIFGVT